MYKCNSCGCVFDEADLARTNYWSNDFPGEGPVLNYSYEVCPSCGCSDLEEGEACAICDEGFAPLGQEVCDDCIEEFGNYVRRWKKDYHVHPDLVGLVMERWAIRNGEW